MAAPGTLAEKLKAPFDASEIKWRAGATTKDKKKCIALCYIDARAVMRRLDEVIGQEHWSTRLILGEGRYVCELSLFVPVTEAGKTYSQWIAKSDAAGDTEFEGAKGGASDAFKRAAVQWGIFRYGYEMESPWVPYDATRKRITDEGMRTCKALVEGGNRKPAATKKGSEKKQAPKSNGEQLPDASQMKALLRTAVIDRAAFLFAEEEHKPTPGESKQLQNSIAKRAKEYLGFGGKAIKPEHYQNVRAAINACELAKRDDGKPHAVIDDAPF